MKSRQVKAMSDPQVDADGWYVSFTLVDGQDGRTRLSFPVEALDQVICNLEALAQRALLERSTKEGTQPYEPNPRIQATTVIPDFVELVEEPSSQIFLVFHRRGRSQLRAALSREAYESFQKVMMEEPTTTTMN